MERNQSSTLSQTNFAKIDGLFFSAYCLFTIFAPLLSVGDQAFSMVSLTRLEEFNQANLGLLNGLSWTVFLVLTVSLIVKAVLLRVNWVSLALLESFLCMIFGLVALFYFKNILEASVSISYTIGMSYYLRQFCLLGLLLTNYLHLRKLCKNKNQHSI